MSFEIAQKILESHRGSRFIKTDLHIHTPASMDWDEKNPDPAYKSANIKPDQFVKAALEKGLRLIAITDHNSVEWCEPIIQAAKGTPLTVLPGFELTTRPGVHILAIFDPSVDFDDLRGILRDLGIDKKRFGDPELLTEPSIEDVSFPIIKKIQGVGGIIIPAHIHSGSGIIGRMKGGQASKDFLEKSGCDILEVPLDSIPDIVKGILRSNPNRFAIIDGSDAHQLDQIGCKPIWLKMDTAGLNGLRQIAIEPLKRICFTEPQPNQKLRILGLYSNGGILKDQVLGFNSELNCLIGGRGAGKSAVIDYLRFVLDSVPVDEDLRNHLYDRFADLIRNTTTVYTLIEDSESRFWLYERTLVFDKKKKGTKEIIEFLSAPSIVYQIIPNPPQAVKLNENYPLQKIEFYGQGEVQSITETAEPKRQLKLVDDFVQMSLNQRKVKCVQLESDLVTLEGRLNNLGNEIDLLEIDIAELPQIKARIREIEADLKANNLEEHQVWEDANLCVILAIDHIIQQKANLDSISFANLTEKAYTVPLTEANEVFNSLVQDIQQAIKLLSATEVALKARTESNLSAILEKRKNWDAFYNQELERFTDILRKQGVENLAALNKELADKKRTKEIIVEGKMPRLVQARNEFQQLIIERGTKLGELLGSWVEIGNIRKAAAERMTDKLGKAVVIEIRPHEDLNDYFSFLDSISQSGIHSKADQLQKVVENISPIELARAIQENNSALISEKAGVTTNTAEKLLEISKANEMRLERVRCDDIANIYLVLEGQNKNLNDLSQGEKCTAILSVILLDEHSPLVIDQPEDELDHNFIMANVVDTLGNVKQKCDPLDPAFIPKNGRQFIIATHNQNIPVLGDAELILKMHKVTGEDRCEVECSHGIEHPVTIRHILSLEGGAEAFERRRRKYATSKG